MEQQKFIKRVDIGGNKTIRLYRRDYDRWEMLKARYNVPDAVRSAISRLFDEMQKEAEALQAQTEEQAG